MKKYDRFCPVRDIMAEIGSKWAILIMHTLETEVKRFSDIWREIPDISQKVLTQKLRTLESFNLIERTVYAEVPPRVEYKLTTLGHSFMEVLHTVLEWAVDNRESCLSNKSK